MEDRNDEGSSDRGNTPKTRAIHVSLKAAITLPTDAAITGPRSFRIGEDVYSVWPIIEKNDLVDLTAQQLSEAGIELEPLEARIEEIEESQS